MLVDHHDVGLGLPKGAGCGNCSDTGFKGRVALYEVMVMTDELKEFVLVPMSARLGEPADKALLPNSQFAKLVESFTPNRTVITVYQAYMVTDIISFFVKPHIHRRSFHCGFRAGQG